MNPGLNSGVYESYFHNWMIDLLTPMQEHYLPLATLRPQVDEERLWEDLELVFCSKLYADPQEMQEFVQTLLGVPLQGVDREDSGLFRWKLYRQPDTFESWEGKLYLLEYTWNWSSRSQVWSVTPRLLFRKGSKEVWSDLIFDVRINSELELKERVTEQITPYEPERWPVLESLYGDISCFHLIQSGSLLAYRSLPLDYDPDGGNQLYLLYPEGIRTWQGYQYSWFWQLHRNSLDR